MYINKHYNKSYKQIMNKNLLIITIYAENSKIQHAFMIKILEKVGQKGTYINIMKVTYEKLSANTILNGEKLKQFY